MSTGFDWISLREGKASIGDSRNLSAYQMVFLLIFQYAISLYNWRVDQLV